MTTERREKVRRAAGVGVITAGGAIPGATLGYHIGKRMGPGIIQRRMQYPNKAQTSWLKRREASQIFRYTVGKLLPSWEKPLTAVKEGVYRRRPGVQKAAEEVVKPLKEWWVVPTPRSHFSVRLAQSFPIRKTLPGKAAILGGALTGAAALGGGLYATRRKRKK